VTTDAANRRLGATVVGGATRFEVWAPDASLVEVHVERDDDTDVGIETDVEIESEIDIEIVRLEREAGAVAELDTWSVTVAGVGHGDRYRFRLDGGDWLADPASRWQPDGVHGPSAVVDESVFRWHDDAWTGVALDDTVLYEMHVGTFTVEGTFDAAIRHLPRLHELGVTTIEVMPVAAFPGTRNWGYDGVFPFAVQESYGGPTGLARFVDAAHRFGLGVVLDVVYNHLGPEGNVLWAYAPYFTDAHRTPWGDAVNVAEYGSDGVRRYLVENAVGWIRDFHLDGLRLDAVHAIVDPTPIPFVQELTSAVHDAARAAGRTALVTIESSANDPRIVRGVADHGWGCDAVWDDDVHHALRVALTGERHEYYANYSGAADVAKAWEHRWVYSGQYSPGFGRRHGAPADDIDHERFVVFDTNHDHIGNTPAGTRLLADADQNDPRHRLAAAAILLSPFTPMLFMGEEYGETAPFPYFIDHGDADLVEAVRAGRQREFSGANWSGGVADPADPATFERATLDVTLTEREPHRSRLAMYTELLRIRREHPVLTDPAAQQHVSIVGDTMFVVRSLPDVTASLVFNFSGDSPEHPAPDAADTSVFDSDDPRWCGDHPDAGPTDTATIAPWSARLSITFA
jgi:maltooligosyltrehalose trehalohydrolase